MSTRSNDHAVWHPAPRRTSRTVTDGGYTLIELLIVVLILGVLLGAVTLAVGGMSTEAADTGCDADRRQLHVAVGAYQAQTGSDTIPSTPDATPAPVLVDDHDRFERTLVQRGFLRSVSEFHDVHADGTVTPQEPSSC